jgi:choline dehydrogenase-like flavoprotein
LSEDPGVSVLLLEAGVNDKDEPLAKIPIMAQFLQLSSIDWRYKSERQDGFCLGMTNQVKIWYIISRRSYC